MSLLFEFDSVLVPQGVQSGIVDEVLVMISRSALKVELGGFVGEAAHAIRSNANELTGAFASIDGRIDEDIGSSDTLWTASDQAGQMAMKRDLPLCQSFEV